MPHPCVMMMQVATNATRKDCRKTQGRASVTLLHTTQMHKGCVSPRMHNVCTPVALQRTKRMHIGRTCTQGCAPVTLQCTALHVLLNP